ncbi:MAG: hypothetical protein ABEJ99_01550 [Candidatus Nanohaloarchaea archaeon]
MSFSLEETYNELRNYESERGWDTLENIDEHYSPARRRAELEYAVFVHTTSLTNFLTKNRVLNGRSSTRMNTS